MLSGKTFLAREIVHSVVFASVTTFPTHPYLSALPASILRLLVLFSLQVRMHQASEEMRKQEQNSRLFWGVAQPIPRIKARGGREGNFSLKVPRTFRKKEMPDFGSQMSRRFFPNISALFSVRA